MEKVMTVLKDKIETSIIMLPVEDIVTGLLMITVGLPIINHL